MKRALTLPLLLVLVLTGATVAYAQQSEQPTVQAAFFYSPSCPHCHIVMDEFFPGVIERYGEQLEIYYINVSQQGGSALFYDACYALSIPSDRCGSVPMLVVGDTYMVGSGEIPDRMETVVDDLLATGGADLSTLPALWQILQEQQSGTAATAPTADGLSARLQAEPLAMSTALVVLAALLVSLVAVGRIGVNIRRGRVPTGLVSWPTRVLIAIALLGGVAVIGGVVTSSTGLPMILAALAGALLLVAAGTVLWTSGASLAKTLNVWRWLLPMVIVAGGIVAAYLSVIEVGQREAACGIVGDCNAVQMSAFATIAGVPVGVIGVVGYVAMLLSWAVGEFAVGRAQVLSRVALLGMTLFGVVFSAYLTFLEPFVIGAVCAWCVTSALVMLALLWLVGPFGWIALADLLDGSAPQGAQPRSSKQATGR